MRAMMAAAAAMMVPGVALAQQPATAAQASDADRALLKLFADTDERDLRENPVSAIGRGDLRFADSFGDYLTEARTERARRYIREDQAALDRIDRAKLTPVDQIAYDVFAADLAQGAVGLSPDVWAVTRLLPLSHQSGYQVWYPSFASGKGAAPFKTVADYENNLKRNRGYAETLDRSIPLMREGMAKGVTQPKLVVRNMIEQFDNLDKDGVEGSVFFAPTKTFPASIPAAEQARLKAAYAAQIRNVILPAHKRVRDFLANVYLAKARDTVGLSALPGGDKLYAYRIYSNTTLPLKAEDVHRLGLSEVARILKEMEAQKARAGFTGTLPQFFDYLRTDAKFQPKTAEELRLGYEAIGRRVDTTIRTQFSLIPKTPLEIRPVPDFKARTAAAGSYEEGTPDGSRPGVFYYNTFDLPIRFTWGMETLYLHEAVPGHHFQISLAQENAALPAFMRFGGNTAFIEGWALYAETLWKPLGLETDPLQRLGGLSDEMLRAMRLVVDTGLHAKGWSRDQAITYMMANSPMSRTDATAEVERYIAIPGQALAYKIGQLTILKLKAQAQKKQGARFDPRVFHAEVLDTGALPMPVLEKKIGDWLAR